MWLTFSIWVQSLTVRFLTAVVLLYQERPRHVVALFTRVAVWGGEGVQPPVNGSSCCWYQMDPCCTPCSRPLSVRPPAASRILSLTSDGQVWAKVRAREFPQTPVSNQLQQKDKCTGRALLVNQHTSQQNRCVNSDRLSLYGHRSTSNCLHCHNWKPTSPLIPNEGRQTSLVFVIHSPKAMIVSTWDTITNQRWWYVWISKRVSGKYNSKSPVQHSVCNKN